jgi:hypothetical protein
MKLLEIIRESFSTLSLNKMRTGLRSRYHGIGSVIALISIGQGISNQFKSIQSLGQICSQFPRGSVLVTSRSSRQ